MPSCPGPGIGGHCIPLDPTYLAWQLRRERDAVSGCLKQARTSTSRCRQWEPRIAGTLNEIGRTLKGADPDPGRRIQAGRRRHPGVAVAEVIRTSSLGRPGLVPRSVRRGGYVERRQHRSHRPGRGDRRRRPRVVAYPAHRVQPRVDRGSRGIIFDTRNAFGHDVSSRKCDPPVKGVSHQHKAA